MKIAFVIPWYGKGIPGGAESECAQTAIHLKSAGFEVEILTTCVRDFHADWHKDFYREGEETIDGILVRRFPADKGSSESFHAVNRRLVNIDLARFKAMWSCSPAITPVFGDDERIYIKEGVNSKALYDYIEGSRDRYDFFIFIPYMFGTTYFGSIAAGDKAVLIPCLHDESYAYMSVYKRLFRDAAGIIFHSGAEERLARRIYGGFKRGVLLGEGVETEFTSDPGRFIKKYSIPGPFVLYAGRKDPCKNTPLLLDFFQRFKDENPARPLKLVLIGSGKISVPGKYRGEILDLGYMDKQDKFDAYGAALCLCQPSVNESFSLVLMEAWAAGTPALVHAGCDVTRDFCVESGGGLYFSDYPEFAECLLLLSENEAARKALGERGSAFVKSRFSWDAVTKRLSDVLKGWKDEDRGTSAPF